MMSNDKVIKELLDIKKLVDNLSGVNDNSAYNFNILNVLSSIDFAIAALKV